jgi:hypothetical protein
MMKTIHKRLKPTNIDINLIYKCPTCSIDHWLTLKEAQEPKFIIVCYCGNKFKVKTIDNVSLKYKKSNKSESKANEDNIPIDILNACCTILVGYGFEKKEAIDLIRKAYKKLSEDQRCISSIVKLSLTFFGESNGS